MNWPEAINRFRKIKGITQQSLANMIGADATSISRWERKRDLPNAEFQRRLLALFEKSPDFDLRSNNSVVVNWADVCKKLRTRLDLSQLQLAERLNVDPTTVSRWERQRDTPSLAIQQQLLTMSRNATKDRP